jgi:hypothetical protein
LPAFEKSVDALKRPKLLDEGVHFLRLVNVFAVNIVDHYRRSTLTGANALGKFECDFAVGSRLPSGGAAAGGGNASGRVC